jgi:S1-C subfamily serine protease
MLEYSELYPKMPIDIVLFFAEIDKGKDNEPKFRSIEQFIEHYRKEKSIVAMLQPYIISRMCDVLVENRYLSKISSKGYDGMFDTYYCTPTIRNIKTEPNIYNKIFTYLIYGFKYIYYDYQKYVLPIEHTTPKGDKSLGSCFLYKGVIVTAKHCIEGAAKIAIKGISKTLLETSSFEVHENPNMDILIIRPSIDNSITNSIILSKEAHILEEVMTLGYPRIAGYHTFLTAEHATVSSRYTPSIGQVVAKAEDIWIRQGMLLITAKIKGGNSGGTVIAKGGFVVGITVNLPHGDGNYDELGYGTVIPISFVNELIESNSRNIFPTKGINFEDFKD